MFEHRRRSDSPPAEAGRGWRTWRKGTRVFMAALALGAVAAPFAVAAGEGNPLRGGVRNPSSNPAQSYSRETEVIADNNDYGTRQSNKGEGGGAIYGCRSAPGAEPCIRGTNLNNGRAFEFFTTTGGEAGLIQVGANPAPNPGAVPFRTNASARVDNLNADSVDGATAEDLVTRTAVVNSDGTRVRGRGSTSSNLVNSGEYDVTFNRDISACTYTATLGVSGTAGAVPAGSISVARSPAGPNVVRVSTDNTSGADRNRSFQLAVNC